MTPQCLQAINTEEEKIEALQTYADQLIQSEHYAGPDITEKKKEVEHILFLHEVLSQAQICGWPSTYQ